MKTKMKTTEIEGLHQLQMLSIKTAKALSSLGSTKIYSEIARGNLRCVKVGRRTLITAKDFSEWTARFKSPNCDNDNLKNGDAS